MSVPKKILHIEDNFENRILIRRLLLAGGFDLIEAENATEAMELLDNHQPDMILMDMNMPDIDGYTLTRQLRRIDKLAGIPIIAITANVMKGDREKSLQAGCDGYIEKPIDVDRFIDQVNLFFL